MNHIKGKSEKTVIARNEVTKQSINCLVIFSLRLLRCARNDTKISYSEFSKYCLLCSLVIFMSCANAQDKKTTGTLKEMVAGDHACYVDFVDEQGQPFHEMAGFEICERTDLIGQQVHIEYEEGNVYAASCEGDMDCPDTETVMLVTQLEPLSTSVSGITDCFENAMDQSALNKCSVEEYQMAESEMHKVYAAIQKQYQDDPKFLEKLKLSQEAWLEFRDAEVEAHYPHQDEPGYYGSVLPMCMNGLLAELTRIRTQQLQQWLQEREEGNVCG